MPTVLRIGSLRFHFYSNEGLEPGHIHVANSDGECKFWLNPIRLAINRGIKPADLRKIEQLVYKNREFLTEKYYEFHRR
ncbi:MAG: DUF4160 domain-containing protein [Leptospiraceae bacterium]|nr:DUF4160 domain-containing protein [Leptospiraceae bacterium]